MEEFAIHARAIDIGGSIVTLHEVVLPDRARSPRPVRWLLQIELERILYGSESNGGALYKLLQRNELLKTTLCVDKASVTKGHVKQSELDEIMSTIASKSARKANLVPTRCAVVAIKSLGDGIKTRGILQGLSEPLPRAWELRAQMEEEAKAGEYDLLAAEELANEEIANEMEEMALSTELAVSFEEFATNQDDEADSRSYVLTAISTELASELKLFEDHKTSALNRFRAGAACVDTTFANNKGSALRFLGWFSKHGPNAITPPQLGTVFADARLGEWVQSFLEWCKGRGCMSSSLANYVSGERPGACA